MAELSHELISSPISAHFVVAFNFIFFRADSSCTATALSLPPVIFYRPITRSRLHHLRISFFHSFILFACDKDLLACANKSPVSLGLPGQNKPWPLCSLISTGCLITIVWYFNSVLLELIKETDIPIWKCQYRKNFRVISR